MKLQLSLLLSLALLGFGLASVNNSAAGTILYHEMYREGYHFSPPQNWMNDPNGLVYFNGKYHLFYQYNPYSAEWGHMSWGHATSTDLVHWKNLPLAIPEYNGIMIFSGSAVVDKNNVSGLCDSQQQGGCMLAFYAADSDSGQAQALAYSNDQGFTWTEYPGNPIINEGLKDFRDPKVFWYEPEQKWIMATVLATLYKVRFYTSQDLIHWTQLSEFGPEGSTAGVWECPDLFPLTLDDGTQKWVLTTSVNGKVQYFIGDFDGQTFVNSNPSDLVLIVDQGMDYYAAVTWNDDPLNRRLMIGWLDNWEYAGALPTSVWRGQQSIVRELNLIQYSEGIRLVQQPIDALAQLRNSSVNYTNIQLNETLSSLVLNLQGVQLEIIAEFQLPSNQTGSVPTDFGVKVFSGSSQATVIGYNVTSQSLFVDRTDSGFSTFNPSFPCVTTQAMSSNDGSIQLHILVDQSSVEVFGNDGEVVMSNLIFPDPQQNQVIVYVNGGDVTVTSFNGYVLSGIWTNPTDEELESVVKDFLAI